MTGAVIFGGLPGSGKTTVARALASRIGAVHLRIDSIEETIRASGKLADGADIGPLGYQIAAIVAADNRAAGAGIVIIDSVNPLALTRRLYRDAVDRALEVEIVCSDAGEHRRRVETRLADIEGFRLPDWREVETRTWEAWTEPHLVLDTARLGVDECVDRLVAASEATFGPRS